MPDWQLLRLKAFFPEAWALHVSLENSSTLLQPCPGLLEAEGLYLHSPSGQVSSAPPEIFSKNYSMAMKISVAWE